MTSTPATRSLEISEESQFLERLYSNWAQTMASNPELSMRLLRSIFDEWHQPTREPENVTYKEEVIGGAPGIWALPNSADQSKVLLYAHGGGFAVGSAASHRKLAAHVAQALGATAFVLDYRRAPEHPHPAQVEDGVATFTALTERGIAPENITTIGDSAGGNLAVSVPLALREQGKDLPGRIIAFSPWLDMENEGETLTTNDATDALITVALLEGMAAGVLSDSVAPTNPLANPLHADLTGLPPLYINAGSVEALVDNATRLRDRAEQSDVDVTLSIVEDMQHVFPCLAGRASEADEEIRQLAEWYRG